MRWPALLIAFLAPAALAGCDGSFDPLGLYPEQTVETAAPLELTGRVVDAANIIPESKEAELTQRLKTIEQETLAQIVIVTTPDLQGQDVADYTLALGNSWGIGDEKRNDGVILLVAPDDREARIEVGIGLEDILTDERSLEIMDVMVPEFAAGDYVIGIEIGLGEIDADLRQGLEIDVAA